MSLPADIISKIVQCLMGLNIYKVILFGSYAKGTATKDSDIDLVVILDTEEFAKTFKEQNARYLLVSNAVREINYQIPMDILVYSKAEYDYSNKQDTIFFKEIRNTGKVLYEK